MPYTIQLPVTVQSAKNQDLTTRMLVIEIDDAEDHDDACGQLVGALQESLRQKAKAKRHTEEELARRREVRRREAAGPNAVEALRERVAYTQGLLDANPDILADLEAFRNGTYVEAKAKSNATLIGLMMLDEDLKQRDARLHALSQES